MRPAIAIVGMACHYPDAGSPRELWENVLARRQAFRRLPPERLRLEDYASRGRVDADSISVTEAALIEGYELDRAKFRVAGSTFRSADLAHWLALDVAARALADAGLVPGDDWPRESTGVLVGNSLTGEFSRANVMRLRWPYVRRIMAAALAEDGWPAERSAALLEGMEEAYKRSFPPMSEESLAGGLSNTIAGRICSHFGLRGGGYTVDGACASSLLAAAQACSALAAGDLDAAVVGGVDLSLDPFELVGFSRTGALARDGMRVYDARADGFLPGEGCGFVVLMRRDDAVAQGRRVHATIRGWGVSSDGGGDLTRPEVDGQLLALDRAYRKAGFGIETVAYFEGHGTGTALGDATELATLTRALRQAGPMRGSRAALGSIKANIGHTKAAAGVAGLIKATLVLGHCILPPQTACEQPHPALTADDAVLRVPERAEVWPRDRPLRAGVSAMGFGGINAHLALEGPSAGGSRELAPLEHRLIASSQDAELFLFAASEKSGLARQVTRLGEIASGISRAELTDLAATLARGLAGGQSLRSAVVASSPAELASRLDILRSWIARGVTERLDARAGLFLASQTRAPRIGFLFTGQGSPSHLDGGLWKRRFSAVDDLFASHPSGDAVATEVAQPAIVRASLAGLRVLAAWGIEGCVGVGHSLGELAALGWAGACDEATLLRIASERGQAMADLGEAGGAMASIDAGPEEVAALADCAAVFVACFNAPRKTVISGAADAVAAAVARARSQGYRAAAMAVSHAFHSPLVEPAVPRLTAMLAAQDLRPPQRTVVSTVTGAVLSPSADLRELLVRQVTSPVRFVEAVAAAIERADLWFEVGPGTVLSDLVRDASDCPVLPLDAGGRSLAPLLRAVGAAFALGAPVRHRALFDDRFTRPFDIDRRPRFFVNPCELAPLPEGERDAMQPAVRAPEPAAAESHRSLPAEPGPAALDVVRRLLVEHLELPAAAVEERHRLLDDFHLSSITVGRLVAEAAGSLGLDPPAAPTEFATATVGEMARALEELRQTGAPRRDAPVDRLPPGVDSWVRAFTVELAARPPARPRAPAEARSWRVLGPPGHPLRQAIAVALGAPGDGAARCDGIVVCLPPDPGEEHVGLLLESARAVREEEPAAFVLVQHGGGGGAFARTLHLESGVATRVVDVPAGSLQATAWVAREARDVHGFAEVRYDAGGVRHEPVLRKLSEPAEAPEELPVGREDVLMVSGGGKGIAAECALALARQTGVRLALMGRSRPGADTELARNLERIAAAGVTVRYASADVTDAAAVRSAVAELTAELGPVTALLHGAGSNRPQLLSSLDETAFRRTLAPKLRGLGHLLAAIDPDRLRLLITFGSIIARTGLRGEADYAVANAWLARRVERFRDEHPRCRCLNVEWSLWSGVGMGERLGRVETLVREGVTPIPPEVGVAMLGELLRRPLPRASVVVCGRFGGVPTLKVERPELPLLRYLERPRVYFPGVELVADAELSTDADPYLDDHIFQGQRLFPAAMGLEAMAQAAMAAAGSPLAPVFEQVRFDRPIVVPRDERLTLRVAALVREPERVDVVLRTAATDFQVNHFRARCLFDGSGDGEHDRQEAPASADGRIPLEPGSALYGSLLFQRGRFQRLAGYRVLRARECVAEIAADGAQPWFGRYLPPDLVLGDPGRRDATIHAIQACIPHATVLPVAVDRLVPGTAESGCVVAHERYQDGDLLVYDVAVNGTGSPMHERWEGLRLRAVGPTLAPDAWPAPLVAPYVERSIADLVPGARVAVALEHSTEPDRRGRSDVVLRRLLGNATIRRRTDGKPELSGQRATSIAHAGRFVLAVAGRGPLGCDLEPVTGRSAREWRDLLGRDRFLLAGRIACEHGEDDDSAATRVWAAVECLKKAGAVPAVRPLTLTATRRDGWVLLESGDRAVVTLLAPLREVAAPMVLAVALDRSAEGAA